jgi:hypothetical protein
VAPQSAIRNPQSSPAALPFSPLFAFAAAPFVHLDEFWRQYFFGLSTG